MSVFCFLDCFMTKMMEEIKYRKIVGLYNFKPAVYSTDWPSLSNHLPNTVQDRKQLIKDTPIIRCLVFFKPRLLSKERDPCKQTAAASAKFPPFTGCEIHLPRPCAPGWPCQGKLRCSSWSPKRTSPSPRESDCAAAGTSPGVH